MTYKPLTRIAASLILVCIATIVAPSLAAQDDVIKTYETARAEFEGLNKQVEELSEQFRSASEEERTAIREKYIELADEIELSFDALRSATVAAYQVTGEENENVAFDLFRLAMTYESEENHASAFELFSMLMANDSKVEGLYTYAGMAAFGTNQFELAKQYWDKARDEDALESQHRQFAQMVDDLMVDWQAEQKIRAEEAAADDLPRVVVETSKGPITIELFENQAPGAVGNFVSLVEAGYYDGLSFHRVLPNFMAQGGCPDGTGAGGPGYKIYCETEREDYRRHFAGTLSMAHAGKDTGGSQFFLTFLPTPHLNARHTAFGRVIDGWEVLSELERVDPRAPRGPEPDTIISAKVVRKRDHAYEPNKVE